MEPRVLKTESTAPVTIGRAMLHEIAVKHALERFSLKGSVDMTFILAAGYNIAWIEPGYDLPKDHLAASMRRMLRHTHAHAYSLISEAWIAATTGLSKEAEKELLDHANEHGVASLPKHMRDDILMVQTFGRDGGYDDSQWLVTVRRHGPNFLGPRVDIDPATRGGSEGRFWNLLKDE